MKNLYNQKHSQKRILDNDINNSTTDSDNNDSDSTEDSENEEMNPLEEMYERIINEP